MADNLTTSAMRRLLVVFAVGVALCSGDTLSEFRSIFTSHLQYNNPFFSEDQMRQSLLFPTPELVQARQSGDLGAVDAAFARVKPSDCKRLDDSMHVGSNGLSAMAPLAARRAAGKAPVTIISLNGMAGEFVPRPALLAAYNASSVLAREFKQLLQAHPRLTVPVWDNKRLSDVQVPLGELMLVGSVDAPDGTVLYNVVLLVQREMSLESLLHYDIVVPRIVSRITKFLDLVGSRVDDFVLVGFSRGTVDALHIMSQADTLPWGSRIRGVITLDGVALGSGFADCGCGEVRSDLTGLCENLHGAMDWVERLADGLVPKMTHSIQNTALITAVSTQVGLALARVPIPAELLRTHLAFPDALKTWDDLVREILFTFDVMHPVLEYEENILKLKNLVGAFVDSVHLLTSRGRAAWWANHTLPTDRLYASVTGTLNDRDHTYSEMHPDQYAMRFMYHITAEATGQELIDGLVQTSRQMILPEVHRSLNPRQGPYEAHWLGLFHTTHSGTTLSYAVPCPDGWEDPFPRKTLVDSFATWIAQRSG
eukprot:m51a1_g5176 hypothetical protein (539) ;mRNA; r:153108-155111